MNDDTRPMAVSWALFLLAGLPLVAANGAFGNEHVVRIDLKAEVRLAGERYHLCDIAQVHSPNKRLERNLCGLEIGVPPRVGYTETVLRTQIADRIQRLLPAIRGEMRWEGADAVAIRVDGQALPGRRYQETAERFLAQWLVARYAEFEIELRSPPEDRRVPQGELALEARFAGGQEVAGRMGVLVDVKVDGNPYSTIPVWFDVRAYQEVLVARQRLSPGVALEPSLLESRRMDVTAVGGAALISGADISGMRLSKTIELGQPVPLGALEPLPPVARGNEIAVTSQIRNISVVVLATALEDGFIGERVHVRRGEKGESFVVRVTGKARATTDRGGI